MLQDKWMLWKECGIFATPVVFFDRQNGRIGKDDRSEKMLYWPSLLARQGKKETRAQ